MQNLLLSNFIIFIFINSATPGPNNLMLLHAGIKSGFKACYPHILGIGIGLNIMLALSYWGMATVITELPTVMTGLKIIGTSYLLWLAWQMWITGIMPDVPDETYMYAPVLSRRINPQNRHWRLCLSFFAFLFYPFLLCCFLDDGFFERLKRRCSDIYPGLTALSCAPNELRAYTP